MARKVSMTNFMTPVQPSPELAAIIGDKPRPRTEVTKKLWAYIKENGLQDKVNKRNINAGTPEMKKFFGGEKYITMFALTKHISKHLTPVTEESPMTDKAAAPAKTSTRRASRSKGEVKETKEQRDEAKKDQQAASRVRGDVMKHFEGAGYELVTEKGNLDLKYVRKDAPEFFYIVTPANVVLYDDSAGDKEAKRIGELNFERWATIGYTDAEVQRVLEGFKKTDNTKTADKPVSAEEASDIAQHSNGAAFKTLVERVGEKLFELQRSKSNMAVIGLVEGFEKLPDESQEVVAEFLGLTANHPSVYGTHYLLKTFKRIREGVLHNMARLPKGLGKKLADRCGASETDIVESGVDYDDKHPANDKQSSIPGTTRDEMESVETTETTTDETDE